MTKYSFYFIDLTYLRIVQYKYELSFNLIFIMYIFTLKNVYYISKMLYHINIRLLITTLPIFKEYGKKRISVTVSLNFNFTVER